jgi:hypothetical protein
MSPPRELADLVPDIDLRWTMRDILAKRTLLLASKQDQIDELMRRGWAEMQGERLFVTASGMDALDVY